MDDPFPYKNIQSERWGFDYRVSARWLDEHPEQLPGYRYAPREMDKAE